MSTIKLLIMIQYNETLGEENITISATGIYYFTESMWVYVKDYKIHFSSNMTHEKKFRQDREQIHMFPRVHVGHRVLDSDSGLTTLIRPLTEPKRVSPVCWQPSSSFTGTKRFLSNRLAPSINDTMQRQKSK